MLISENYRAEQERLHERPDYGVMGHVYGGLVASIIGRLGITEVLDYGAGKQVLRAALPSQVFYRAYDPARSEIAERPMPAEFVACLDVMEHIEPDCLDAVLDDLKRLTRSALFVTVSCEPAMKTLSDGRNAHLIQQPMQWWLPKFWDRFSLQTVNRDEHGFWLVAYAC